MSEKTDFRTMYDRDYIGAFDLPLGAGDLTLTIKKVTGGELTAIGGRKSKKPIVHFSGEVKPLICNKTNGKTIAALYGNFVEQWAGKKITLYRATTRSPDGTGEVECIRVRPKAPTGNFDAPAEPQGEKASPEIVQKINEGLLLASAPIRKKFNEKLASMGVEKPDDLFPPDAEAALRWLNTQLDKQPGTQS